MCVDGKCGTVTKENDVELPASIKGILDGLRETLGPIALSLDLATQSIAKFKALADGHYEKPTVDEIKVLSVAMGNAASKSIERLHKLDNTFEGYGMNFEPLIEIASGEAALAAFGEFMKLRGKIKLAAQPDTLAA